MTPTASGGVTPALSAADLIAAVPGLADTGINVDVVDFRRVPGASLTFDDLVELRKAVASALASGADGVVITQGTDTIEETSYLLDLYHAEDRPVVVTGAMRNPSMAGADGPANLLAAIVTSVDAASAGQGVLVVLADEIHAASRVRKTHSTSGATFQSPNGGALGYVVEGQPRYLNQVIGRSLVPIAVKGFPRIGIVTVGLGDNGELLNGIGSKVDGLVVAAMGVGHVPDRLVSVLEKLAAEMPVVLASRTGAGSVLQNTYGFSGSERDLLSRGLIPAGFLHPLKARILLAALLAAGAEKDQIAPRFSLASGYSDAVSDHDQDGH
jgi:L-asparaginase